ncbi:MAG: hypothetical protein Q9M50_03100 [Methylococcales bacterium]|nr:hypothetical protein [Methylococcales bacterium]
MLHLLNIKKEGGFQNTTIDQNEKEDLFLMANFREKPTGLPMVIWVSERGNTKHAPRIKVSTNNNDKMIEGQTVSVSITEPPEIMAEFGLRSKDLQLVIKFIELNRSLLLDYWDSKIDTTDWLPT